MLSVVLSLPASAATLTVCPAGCDHTDFGDAVNAAISGDTVDVGPGTYNVYGPNISQNPLTIRGAGPGLTVLEGQVTSVQEILEVVGDGHLDLSELTIR